MKWVEKICAFIAYSMLSIFVLFLLIALTLWGMNGYEQMQLSNGDIGYRISSKDIVQVQGKNKISLEVYLDTYPVNIADQTLEKVVVKTVWKVKKEHPEVDQIYIRGHSTGLMDVKECSAIYLKKNPNEISFTNYGWDDNKEPDYKKKLVLPDVILQQDKNQKGSLWMAE